MLADMPRSQGYRIFCRHLLPTIAGQSRGLARQMPLLISLLAGEKYVDEIMRCLQSTLAQSPLVRFRALSLRVDMVGLLEFES